jgi:hypothetical protein
MLLLGCRSRHDPVDESTARLGIHLAFAADLVGVEPLGDLPFDVPVYEVLDDRLADDVHEHHRGSEQCEVSEQRGFAVQPTAHTIHFAGSTSECA